MCRFARSIFTCVLRSGAEIHPSSPSRPPEQHQPSGRLIIIIIRSPAVQLCVLDEDDKRRSGKLVQKHFSPRCERENILSFRAATVFFVSLKICNVNWADRSQQQRSFLPPLLRLINGQHAVPLIDRRDRISVGDYQYMPVTANNLFIYPTFANSPTPSLFETQNKDPVVVIRILTVLLCGQILQCEGNIQLLCNTQANIAGNCFCVN